MEGVKVTREDGAEGEQKKQNSPPHPDEFLSHGILSSDIEKNLYAGVIFVRCHFL